MWLADTSRAQRRALIAAYAGYGLDGFDFMVYSFVIPTLLGVWGMSKAQAGYIASAALVASAAGGWAAGVLADRYGRARILQLTILWFAVFTCLCGFAQNFAQLLCARAMQGLGFGGEWAVGSVLVAETIAAEHRGKAAGLVQSSWSVGWAAAALTFWLVSLAAPPQTAWRIVFWLGLLPVLFIVYIRHRVAEPEVYLATRRAQLHQLTLLNIFRGGLLRTTVLATLLSTGMLAGYYSVTQWLPTYLAGERHLSQSGTTAYVLMVILGSWVGYLVSAWLTDLLGRRRGFMLFAAGAAVLVVAYTRMPVAGGMLLVGFAMGFFILGIFAGMGAFLAELYPSAVRGSGQGFCYSIGRGIGGFCPLLIGQLSDRVPLGDSIAVFAVAAYGLVIIIAWMLPETRGRLLDGTAA